MNFKYFTTDIITHVKDPVFHVSISLLGIQITTNKPINKIEKNIGKMIKEK